MYDVHICLPIHTPSKNQKRAYNMTNNVKRLSSYRKDLPNSIRHGVASAVDLKTHRNCAAKLKDGTLCSGGRIAGSMFCYFHDPELEQERADNRASSMADDDGASAAENIRVAVRCRPMSKKETLAP